MFLRYGLVSYMFILCMSSYIEPEKLYHIYDNLGIMIKTEKSGNGEELLTMCYDDSFPHCMVYSLYVTKVPENTKVTIFQESQIINASEHLIYYIDSPYIRGTALGEVLVENADYEDTTFVYAFIKIEETRKDISNKFWPPVLTNISYYDSANTKVLVFIEDENDNHPEFIDGSYIKIGYPNQYLAPMLKPQLIYQVYVVDKDSGLNAAIKYSLDTESNKYLYIDEFGIIYPKSNFPYEDMEIIVNATDQNGEGLTSVLKIMLGILNDINIVKIQLNDVLPIDFESYLKDLSKQLNITVQSVQYGLTGSVLYNKSFTDTAPPGISLQATVYATDIQNNFLHSGELTGLLKDSNNIENVLNITQPEPPTGGLDSTSIALCSIFGVLCISTAAYAFILIRINKKERMKQMYNNKAKVPRKYSDI